MAQRAGNVRVAIGQQESGRRVIESRSRPAHGVVAAAAVIQAKGRASRGVRRIRRCLPGGQMATRRAASRGHHFQTVIVIDVARSARNIRVAVGQREAKSCVIKSTVGPFRNGMARRAGCRRRWETRLDVVGNIPAECRRLVPICKVAAHAVR